MELETARAILQKIVLYYNLQKMHIIHRNISSIRADQYNINIRTILIYVLYIVVDTILIYEYIHDSTIVKEWYCSCGISF